MVPSSIESLLSMIVRGNNEDSRIQGVWCVARPKLFDGGEGPASLYVGIVQRINLNLRIQAHERAHGYITAAFWVPHRRC